MSPRLPLPSPLPPSSFAAASTTSVQMTSPPISTSTTTSGIAKPQAALHSQVEANHDALERAQDDKLEDGLVNKRRAPPQAVAKPSVPAPMSSSSSSSPSSSSLSSSFRSTNLINVDEEHPTDTSNSTSTSNSQNQNQPQTQSPLVPATKNWATPYVLASPTPPSADPARDAFIARLIEGVLVVKHNRKGHSRVRELCTLDGGETFTWQAPTKGEKGAGENKAGHARKRSSVGSSLFGGPRESYAFGDIIEVRRGTVLDPSATGETGTALLRAACQKRDLYKSFSLLTADRTIDFSCDRVEDMTFLVKGFMFQSHEQRRRRVRRAGSSGMGGG